MQQQIRLRTRYKGSIIDGISLTIIALFVFYTICLQYSLGVIPGFMSVCGAIMLVLIFFYILKNRIPLLKPISYLFLFFIYELSVGFFFSKYPSNFNNMLVLILEYIIPMILIILYVNRSKEKCSRILWIFSLSVVVLSLTTILMGTMTNVGAVTIGNYNTNVISTNIMIGTFSTIMLIFSLKNKNTNILLLILVLNTVSQILVASRRGVIIQVIMVLLYYYYRYIYSSCNTKKKLIRFFVHGCLLAIVLGIVFFYNLDEISNLIVVQRFLGGLGVQSGDIARNFYQDTAWRLFLDSPIIGCGLGAVAGEIGMYSHSFYYEILACTGLIGLLLMATQFFTYIIKINRKDSDEEEFHVVQRNYTTWFIICVLVSGVAVVFLYDLSYYYIMAILTILINVSVYTNNSREKKANER